MIKLNYVCENKILYKYKVLLTMLIPAFILYNFVAETDMHTDICIADWYCFRFSPTPYDVKV